MPKKLILIVGLPGSGKSTAADFIERKFNADIVHSGDVIREEVKKRNLNYNPETDAMVAHWFHTAGREELLVKRVWDKIKKSKKNLIVIEGLRSDDQLRYLERIAKNKPFIISIIASFKVRVQRELKRKRFGKKESIDYLKFREKLERMHGIDRLLEKADHTIDNSKLSIKQTDAKLYKLIKEILTK
jgi:dephospho-CoA kinase